jgi:hypothetical protein
LRDVSANSHRLHYRTTMLLAIAGLGVAGGFLLRVIGYGDWSNALWAAATVPVLISLLIENAGSLRRGDVGLDIVAALSMSAALIFGEYLAAAVVALMYASGQFLESFADRRAGREMTALLARVPRSAMRYRDSGLEEVPLDAINSGDRLVIRSGEVVPVDGVADGDALLDYASLTGESLRRSYPGLERAGDRNAMSTYSCRARGDRLGPVARGLIGRIDQGRRRTRSDRAGQDHHPRQDWHADGRRGAPRCDPCRAGVRCRGGLAARRLARSGLDACHRTSVGR